MIGTHLGPYAIHAELGSARLLGCEKPWLLHSGLDQRLGALQGCFVQLPGVKFHVNLFKGIQCFRKVYPSCHHFCS